MAAEGWAAAVIEGFAERLVALTRLFALDDGSVPLETMLERLVESLDLAGARLRLHDGTEVVVGEVDPVVVGVPLAGGRLEVSAPGREPRADPALELAAAWLASAVERARNAGRARLLDDFAAAVSVTLENLENALQLTVERVAAEIGDVCGIWLLSEDGEWLDNVAIHANDPEELAVLGQVAGQRRSVDRTPMAVPVVRSAEALFLPELTPSAASDLLAPEQRELGQRVPITSLISCPLRSRGEVIGTINISRTRPAAAPYTRADHAFLEQLAGRAAVAFDNARLYRQAHRAARALARNEQRLRAMFDSSAVGIVVRDTNALLVECNRAYAAMLGYTAEELTGEHLSAVSQDDASWFPGDLARDPRHATVEHTYKRRDGSPLHARVTISPIWDDDGTLLYWLGLVEDVSERRSLEEQLRHAQKMDAIGRLAGGVAHDFNNLLTVITGFNRRILSRLAPDDPLRVEACEIARAAARGAELTSQLLAFSRREPLEPRVLDLNVLVRDMERLLRRLIGEELRLDLRLEPQPWCIRADPGQLEQVLANLAVNARDAMPGGGVVSIETANVELVQPLADAVLAAAPGSYVLLAVTDTGSGIDPQMRDQLFEPFFTTKGVGEGTGLGLATVYGIVERSGGGLRLESEPGAGARFELYLPRVEEPAAVPAAGESEPREVVAAGDRLMVLLVEDDDSLRTLTRLMLEDFGYGVVDAEGPREALELCARLGLHVDVLVSDVIMPGMRGPELARRLRAMRPGLAVLFLTGYSDEAVEGPCLRKPFTEEQLGAKLAELVERSPV